MILALLLSSILNPEQDLQQKRQFLVVAKSNSLIMVRIHIPESMQISPTHEFPLPAITYLQGDFALAAFVSYKPFTIYQQQSFFAPFLQRSRSWAKRHVRLRR